VVNQDFKDTKESTVATYGKSEPGKLKGIIFKFIEGLHKFGLYILIAVAVGIYIGITVARGYYTTKMDEIIKVGGFLHSEKVYTIAPK
jgi:hypothetical protein